MFSYDKTVSWSLPYAILFHLMPSKWSLWPLSPGRGLHMEETRTQFCHMKTCDVLSEVDHGMYFCITLLHIIGMKANIISHDKDLLHTLWYSKSISCEPGTNLGGGVVYSLCNSNENFILINGPRSKAAMSFFFLEGGGLAGSSSSAASAPKTKSSSPKANKPVAPNPKRTKRDIHVAEKNKGSTSREFVAEEEEQVTLF